MKSRIICFVVAICLFDATSFAQDITQNSSFNSVVGPIFDCVSLDVTHVPTGHLLDRAFEVVNVRRFNGLSLTDSNYVDIPTFRNILLTMNSAKVNVAGAACDANTFTDALTDTQVVKIGGAVFDYNFIVNNAISDNLLSYYGGKIHYVSINNVWQNPFGHAYVFACTPNIEETNGQSVTYSLQASNICGNLLPVKWEFDYGNGVYNEIQLPYNNTIIYNQTGIQHLRFRVTLSDQTQLVSHSQINVKPTHNNTPSNITTPDATIPYVRYYNGKRVAAEVKYKIGSNNGGIVKRPLIYVEGFDTGFLPVINHILTNGGLIAPVWIEAWLASSAGGSFGKLNFNSIYNSSSFPSIIKSDYDFFYVDWLTPEEDIKANAYLLSEIIKSINSSIKSNSLGERNIVYGHSMGGLIARYALRSMEIAGEDHQTSYYVSHDSPHLGANVPIGAVFLIRDLYRLLYGNYYIDGFLKCHLFDLVVAPAISVLESSAARQMLYNYVDRNGNLDNDVHDDWIEDLESIGFPKGLPGFPIENIAIVNGCKPDTTPTNKLFNATLHVGNNFIGWQQLLLGSILKIDSVDANLIAYRHASGRQVVSKSVVYYKKHFPWMELSIPLYSDSLRYSPAGSLGLDYVDASVVADTSKYGNLIDNLDYISYNYNAPVSFIPTASALACPNYSRQFNTAPPTPLIETPFSAFYINGDTNYYHHMVHSGNHWAWLLDQKSAQITGPDGIITTGASFSVAGLAGYSVEEWYSTDSSVASISNISNDGVVTVNNPGHLVIVGYRSNKGYKHCGKHKTILAGFPSDICINETWVSGNTYIAQTLRSDIDAFLDTLAQRGEIFFEWLEKTSLDDSLWVSTSSRTYTLSSNSSYSLFFRIRSGNSLSTPINRLVGIAPPMPKKPFQQDPNIIYTYQGNTWMSYSYFSDPGTSVYNPDTGQFESVPSDYFVMWHTNYPAFANYPDPDRIIINGQTIMRDVTLQQYVGGTLTDMFCFKIMDSTYIQSIIANIMSYPGYSATVQGQLCNGANILQSFTITVTRQIPPVQ